MADKPYLDKKRKRIIFISLPFLILSWLCMEFLVSSSWRIAYENQPILRCLPQSFWLLNTDVNVDAIKKGTLVRVSTSEFQDFYKNTDHVLKIVAGVEGDVIEINDKKLFINGLFAGNLSISYYPPFTDSKYVVQSGEFFIAGSQETTLDSRYIGLVTKEHIDAHAYPII